MVENSSQDQGMEMHLDQNFLYIYLLPQKCVYFKYLLW